MNQNSWQDELIKIGYVGNFSLRELIDACGEHFWDLTARRNAPIGRQEKWMTNNIHSGKRTYGDTPEEAVGRLLVAVLTNDYE